MVVVDKCETEHSADGIDLARSCAVMNIAKELMIVGEIMGGVHGFCGAGIDEAEQCDLRVKYLAFGVSAGLFEIGKDNVSGLFATVLRTTRFRWLVCAVVFGVHVSANCVKHNSRGGVEEKFETAPGNTAQRCLKKHLTLQNACHLNFEKNLLR
jgi:hypothetical protein